ncbi:MAG: hypothetical protein U0637_10795 [Phycisphaerales bacterium]
MKPENTDHNRPPISADRLLAAADAILWAASAPGADPVRLPPNADSETMMGFTGYELEEGAIFLARLGMVELVWRPSSP